jgi:hypothetical protein
MQDGGAADEVHSTKKTQAGGTHGGHCGESRQARNGLHEDIQRHPKWARCSVIRKRNGGFDVGPPPEGTLRNLLKPPRESGDSFLLAGDADHAFKPVRNFDEGCLFAPSQASFGCTVCRSLSDAGRPWNGSGRRT